MESCGLNFLKYYFFAFNILFTVSGLIVLVIGAVVLHGLKSVQEYLGVLLYLLPLLFILVGFLIFGSALIGWSGAIRENITFLNVYAALLSLVCFLEMAAGVCVAVKKATFIKEAKEATELGMQSYARGSKTSWDSIQEAFTCCGMNSPKDWEPKFGDGRVPASCCTTRNNPLIHKDGLYYCKYVEDEEMAHTRGCWPLIRDNMNNYTDMTLGVGIGFAFLELVGILLAILMVYELKRNKNSSRSRY